MDDAAIDRAVVAPMKPQGYHFSPANDAVAEAVRGNPRLAGLARVDPRLRDDAYREFERALNDLGLRGLFLHPWEENFPITAEYVDPLLEMARDRKVPVVIASGYPWVSEALQVGRVATRYRDVTVIATNGCQVNISGLGQANAEIALAENDNLLFQTAGVYREDFLERIVSQHGPNRLLFSSAFPWMDPRLEILRARWAHFSDEEKDLILGKNADRIFFAE